MFKQNKITGMRNPINSLSILPAFILILSACSGQPERKASQKDDRLAYEKIADAKEPLNVIYILSDDHRHDFMGFTGKVPGLKTPNMDRMASEGVYLKNAFVSTALCSPSRASILTGQYAHTHQVVDNQAPLPDRSEENTSELQSLIRTSYAG